MDGRRFEELTRPYVHRREPKYGLFELWTDDGDGADVFAKSESDQELTGITVQRLPGVAVLDIVARLALELDATIVLPELIALVVRDTQATHLPPELRAHAVVIDPTGPALLRAITGSQGASCAEPSIDEA